MAGRPEGGTVPPASDHEFLYLDRQVLWHALDVAKESPPNRFLMCFR